MQDAKHRVCLVILDGWGRGNNDRSNAIYQADTPFADYLDEDIPHGQLYTDGEHVGLPPGQMGNSEVGHINIGAGRTVYQDLMRINKAVREGDLQRHPVLIQAIKTAKRTDKNIHLIGLVSDGGVHSHIVHLKALCDVIRTHDASAFIHAFTDGRDTDPKSGVHFLKEIEEHIGATGSDGNRIKVASVIGRYYAMDRDRRWERIRKAYDLLVNGNGEVCTSASEAAALSYQRGITDEFIEPFIIAENGDNQPTRICEGDVVICFNFRTDRCREITQVLTQRAFPEFEMSPLSLHYVTMTNYDDTFRNISVIFDKDNLEMTLGEVISKAGKTQARIAETEKYPHVTFFFSGGREEVFPGEQRILIHSPKVATYDLQPEMSAPEVAVATQKCMKADHPDFICLNFANPDMVGHTGVFGAIVKAVEATDQCLKQVVGTGLEEGYSFIIIADHGNAEYAINEDGSPNTAHTTNPVPVWIIHPGIQSVKDGILADVAPTILNLMDIPVPEVMTGKSLV